MFDTLLELPLFKGVSRELMSDLAGRMKFHFVKYEAGATIINEGEACDAMRFIVAGDACVRFAGYDGKFAVEQTISGPDLITPDYLFGLTTTYPCSVTALTTVSTLQFSKADYLNILHADRVFLLNFLNYLSMDAQKCVGGALAITTGEVEQRIASCLVSLSQPRARNIVMWCAPEAMCRIFGADDSQLEQALKSMVRRGVIKRGPDCIRVTDRRRLTALLGNNGQSGSGARENASINEPGVEL